MLKKHRIDKNLTQKDLSLLIGVEEASISRYENGTRQPSHDVLNKLCEALKLNQKDELQLRRSFGRKEE